MLEVDIMIRNVDYSTIITKMIEVNTDKEYDNGTDKILNKLKVLPLGMLKGGILLLPESKQNDLAMNYFSNHKDEMADLINEWITKEQIQLHVNKIVIRRKTVKERFHIRIYIEKIQYGSIIVRYFSRIIDKVEMLEKEEKNFQIRALSILKRVPVKSFARFVEGMPKDVKEDLFMLLISEYEEKIIHMLYKVIEKEGIKLEISEIKCNFNE